MQPPLAAFANYRPLRPIIAPPPSSPHRSAVARPSARLPRPRGRGGHPESEDGLGFSIGADPSEREPIENPGPSRPARRRVRRSGGMADDRRCRPSEDAFLRRSARSTGLGGAEFALGRRFPDLGNRLPRPPIGPGGRLERGFGEACSGGSLPENSCPIFRPVWQLIGVNADELPRNLGPGTQIPRQLISVNADELPNRTENGARILGE